MKNPNADLKPFILLRDDLTLTSNNLLLKNNKIIIPEVPREKAIALAHADT